MMKHKLLNGMRLFFAIMSFSYGITMLSGVNFTNLLGTWLTLIIWGTTETILLDPR